MSKANLRWGGPKGGGWIDNDSVIQWRSLGGEDEEHEREAKKGGERSTRGFTIAGSRDEPSRRVSRHSVVTDLGERDRAGLALVVGRQSGSPRFDAWKLTRAGFHRFSSSNAEEPSVRGDSLSPTPTGKETRESEVGLLVRGRGNEPNA